MASDLVNRLVGLPETRVIDLLGDPDEELAGDSYLAKLHPHSERVFSYYIGSWSMFGMDDAFVCVYFDSNGNTTHAEIAGY